MSNLSGRGLACLCLAIHLVSFLPPLPRLFFWASVRKSIQSNMSPSLTVRTSVETFYSPLSWGNQPPPYTNQRREVSKLYLQFCIQETAELRMATHDASWQYIINIQRVSMCDEIFFSNKHP